VKRKRYSVEQIVAILKQAEVGVPVAELIRQAGISEQTFYRWKNSTLGCFNLYKVERSRAPLLAGPVQHGSKPRQKKMSGEQACTGQNSRSVTSLRSIKFMCVPYRQLLR
jgi:hypothetical protein